MSVIDEKVVTARKGGSLGCKNLSIMSLNMSDFDEVFHCDKLSFTPISRFAFDLRTKCCTVKIGPSTCSNHCVRES